MVLQTRGRTISGWLGEHPSAAFASLLLIVLATTFLVSEAGAGFRQTDPLVLPGTPLGRMLLRAPDERLAMPLLHVRVNEIGNSWQEPRAGRRRHEGQDIFAPVGTPVYSATDGVVAKIGDAGKGGNAVSVLGAGGRTYYYAHLSGFAQALQVGDTVTPGTLLGYVGKTGNALHTPAHLHFGVYSLLGAVDPLPLLLDRIPATARTGATELRQQSHLKRANRRHHGPAHRGRSAGHLA